MAARPRFFPALVIAGSLMVALVAGCDEPSATGPEAEPEPEVEPDPEPEPEPEPSAPADTIRFDADSAVFALDTAQTTGAPVDVVFLGEAGGAISVDVRGVFRHAFDGFEYPLVTSLEVVEDSAGRRVARVVFPLEGRHRLDVLVDDSVRGSLEVVAEAPVDLPIVPVDSVRGLVARYESALAVLGDTVVVVGGECGTLWSCWENGQTGLPTQFFHVGSRSFSLGPRTPDDFLSDQTESFAGKAGTGWRAAALNDSLHVLKEDRHWVLDRGAGTWLERAAPPVDASRSLVAEVADVLYLFSDSGAVHTYDPASDAWAARSDVAVEPGATMIAVVEGGIYLVGRARMQRVDPASGAVRDFPAPPLGTTQFDVAGMDGAVCTVGGGLFLYRVNRVLRYTYCFAPGDEAWRYMGRTGGRPMSRAVAVGDEIVVVGGAVADGSAAGYRYGVSTVWVVGP